jgi:hypothetical protein
MADNLTRRRFFGAAAAGAAAMAGSGAAAQRRAEAAGATQSPRRPEIIDAHVHLKHGDAARTEYSARVIVETMDAVGIDRSVVFAMSTTTQRSIEMAAAAVQQYPQRLIPYVYALPHYERPVIQEIQGVLKAGTFRGVKIHAGECSLTEYVIDPVLRSAAKYGAPCLVDCLGKYDAARRMAQAFPETKLIIAHLGKYLTTDAGLIDQFIRLAEKCGNVFLDISGVVLVQKIAEAVRRIGSARLIWGTDGPHEKPDTVTFARTELDKVRTLALSDEDKQNILGGTIRSLVAR